MEDGSPVMPCDDGMAISDEYLQNCLLNSRPLGDAVTLDEVPKPVDNAIYEDGSLEPTTPSNTPESQKAAQQSSKASPNVASLRSDTSDILDPDQDMGAIEISKSTSRIGSHGSLSQFPDLTSNLTSQTHDANNNLSNAVIHTPLTNRSILDESGHLLEDVVKTLKEADYTNRIPNSYVPGTLDDVLAKSGYTLFAKIMTSITKDHLGCNRRTARPALGAEQERLREFERNELERIAEGRQQMNMTFAARRATEIYYQKEEERVRKSTEHAIASLDLRELVERELQDTLSEPTELTGEFREENDYENAIRQIEKEGANDIRTRQRRLWKETYYWPMIQQRAKMIGPLPISSGPKTDITPQEKSAARSLISAMGRGQSRDNIFKWTSYWKLLSDLRDKGATTLLLHQTSVFKTYFFQHPKELDMLLS
jgi:hypothetical protein